MAFTFAPMSQEHAQAEPTLRYTGGTQADTTLYLVALWTLPFLTLGVHQYRSTPPTGSVSSVSSESSRLPVQYREYDGLGCFSPSPSKNVPNSKRHKEQCDRAIQMRSCEEYRWRDGCSQVQQ